MSQTSLSIAFWLIFSERLDGYLEKVIKGSTQANIYKGTFALPFTPSVTGSLALIIHNYPSPCECDGQLSWVMGSFLVLAHKKAMNE